MISGPRRCAYTMVTIVATLFCALRAHAQEQRDSARAPRAVLVGVVLRDDSTEKPIVGAEVLLENTGLSTRTDSLGAFRIADIPVGVHSVIIRRVGYNPLAAQLTLVRAELVEREFMLSPAQTAELDTVEVNARLESSSGRGSMGHVITRAQLDKQSNRRMAEVLAQVPGLQVRRGLGGKAWIASSRGRISMNLEYRPTQLEFQQGARRGCYAFVYLDGAIVFAGREPLFDINSLSPDNIESIEYYAGGAQMPARYNQTGAACGVLVVHTRK